LFFSLHETITNMVSQIEEQPVILNPSQLFAVGPDKLKLRIEDIIDLDELPEALADAMREAVDNNKPNATPDFGVPGARGR
jgi:hypothetical protein